MRIHSLFGSPPPALAPALEAFEEEFAYPLGSRRSFRIAHGADYTRFFRAMGEAACFVAESEGQVLGTIAAVSRRLACPDGSELRVAYVADLKVTRRARNSRALLRLMNAARTWVATWGSAAFSVVMDGTQATPLDYTGRAGLPEFRPLATLAVLRFSIMHCVASNADGVVVAQADLVERCYRDLSFGRYVPVGGEPAMRSRLPPMGLECKDGRACGRLEDTLACKRLLVDDGTELVSAHLSSFAFDGASAGSTLLRGALWHAWRLGYPALFVAMAPPDAEMLLNDLGRQDVEAASATVYGTGLMPEKIWNFNTAEI